MKDISNPLTLIAIVHIFPCILKESKQKISTLQDFGSFLLALEKPSIRCVMPLDKYCVYFVLKNTSSKDVITPQLVEI